MRKIWIIDIIVFVFIAAVIFVICLFLPENVPVHFNVKGEADLIVNKYFLLFGTVVPYSIYWGYIIVPELGVFALFSKLLLINKLLR